jgi:hypothetical protein
MLGNDSFRNDDTEASTPLLTGKNGLTTPLSLKRIVTIIAVIIALIGTSLLIVQSNQNREQIHSFMMRTDTKTRRKLLGGPIDYSNSDATKPVNVVPNTTIKDIIDQLLWGLSPPKRSESPPKIGESTL